MRPLADDRLLDLSVVDEAEGRIEKAYDWYFERQKILVQTVLAFSTALSVALVAAAVRGDLGWVSATLIGLLGLSGPSILGYQAYQELRSMPDDYLDKLALLDVLRQGRAERERGQGTGTQGG